MSLQDNMQEDCEESVSSGGAFQRRPTPKIVGSQRPALAMPLLAQQSETPSHSSVSTQTLSPKRPCRGHASRRGLPCDRDQSGVRDTGSPVFGHRKTDRGHGSTTIRSDGRRSSSSVRARPDRTTAHQTLTEGPGGEPETFSFAILPPRLRESLVSATLPFGGI